MQLYRGCWTCESLVELFSANRVLKMNIEFCCHLRRSSSIIFMHNHLQYKAIPSLSFGCRPFFLLADDVFL